MKTLPNLFENNRQWAAGLLQTDRDVGPAPAADGTAEEMGEASGADGRLDVDAGIQLVRAPAEARRERRRVREAGRAPVEVEEHVVRDERRAVLEEHLVLPYYHRSLVQNQRCLCPNHGVTLLQVVSYVLPYNASPPRCHHR